MISLDAYKLRGSAGAFQQTAAGQANVAAIGQ